MIRLDEHDAEDLHELLKISWGDTYTGVLPDAVIADAAATWHSADTLRRQMKNRTVLFAGYEEDGKLLGMVRAAMIDKATLQVFQLYVLPSQQRRGIGKALMGYARTSFPGVRKIILEVATGNGKGINFYRKCGFSFDKETTLKLGSYEIHNLQGSLDLD